MTTRNVLLGLSMVFTFVLGFGCTRLVRYEQPFGDNGAADIAAPTTGATAADTPVPAEMPAKASARPTADRRSGGATHKPGGYASTKVTYAELDSGPLQFNLITPSSGSNFPVVIWIHGGGFGPGGLNAAEGFEDDFTSHGYAIAALAYRSMEDGLFPTQIEDIKGAIRYLRAESAELNIDRDRIFLLGTSSGGLLSSLAGTTGNELYVGTTGGNATVSSEVAGVIDLFGSVTTKTLDSLSPDILPLTYELFGCEFKASCPERQKLPIDKYISKDDPPFLIIHGTDDETVPYEGSVDLDAQLDDAGVEATLLTGEGYGHDKDGLIPLFLDEIFAFLDAH